MAFEGIAKDDIGKEMGVSSNTEEALFFTLSVNVSVNKQTMNPAWVHLGASSVCIRKPLKGEQVLQILPFVAHSRRENA